MFYGQVVNAIDSGKVQIFCPDLTPVTYAPAYGDRFIINVPGYSPTKFRTRFSRSVLLHPSGIDLTSQDRVLDTLSKMIKLSKAATELLRGMEEPEFWNSIRLYKLARRLPDEGLSDSTYRLFLQLGGSKVALITELVALQNIPHKVLFSSMISFLVRVKSPGEQVVSPRYKRDLINVSRRLRNINSVVLVYLKSEREYSDFMHFILSLGE